MGVSVGGATMNVTFTVFAADSPKSLLAVPLTGGVVVFVAARNEPSGANATTLVAALAVKFHSTYSPSKPVMVCWPPPETMMPGMP